MNILAVDIGGQISWAMKCGNVRMLGSTAGLLGWLSIMIEAYTIDLVVFGAAQAKIFHGFQGKSHARLERALKTCEEQNVATKCLDNREIKGFLCDYKAAGGLSFEDCLATKIFATLMLAENRSVAESVDIARLMRDRDKRITDKLGVGAAA
jgi:hypothetical protein